MKHSAEIQTVLLISFLFLNIFSNIVVAPYVTPCSAISELEPKRGIADAVAPMNYGGCYKIFSDIAKEGEWARVIIQDRYGEHLDTSVIDIGEVKSFSNFGIDVAVTGVIVSGNGSVIGTSLAVDAVGKLTIDKTLPPTNKTTCYGNMDCPRGMECLIPLCGPYGCGNNTSWICGDVGCLDEGVGIPGGDLSIEQLYHSPMKCCTGLKAITKPGFFDENCDEVPLGQDMSSHVCSDCGNGVCEEWEEECTCPEDCYHGKIYKPTTPLEIDCESGCLVEEKCLSIGIRKDGKYCSLTEEMVNQKIGNESCDNNFECLTNACLSGKCVEESFIDKIIKFFLSLFSWWE